MSKKLTIVLDPGHGGTDPGAVNGRYKEAEAALGIANKIADKLKAKGHRVVLTRTKDQALLLQQRCDISNAAKADAFISIHCNSAENKDASGIETFKYPGVGEALQKPLFPSRIEQNRSVRFFFTTSKNGVFLPSK